MQTRSIPAVIFRKLCKHYIIVTLLTVLALFVYFMIPPSIDGKFKLIEIGMHRSAVIRLLGQPGNLSFYEAEKSIRYNGWFEYIREIGRVTEDNWITSLTTCYSVLYDKTEHVVGFIEEVPDLYNIGFFENAYRFLRGG